MALDALQIEPQHTCKAVCSIPGEFQLLDIPLLGVSKAQRLCRLVLRDLLISRIILDIPAPIFIVPGGLGRVTSDDNALDSEIRLLIPFSDSNGKGRGI
jgi:hypothetical protein